MPTKSSIKQVYLPFILTVTTFFIVSCQTVYFKTMEKFGYHKRDILVDRVQDASDAQQEAKDQFKSALERFSSVVNFKGGELKEKYDKLSHELETCEAKAEAVHKRIGSVEDVAEALFDEWEAELEQYTNKNLARSSKSKLDDTRERYTKLINAMKRAEKKIDPVLSVFRDQVLFLKHNLNAQAISSLRNELDSIKSDISSLIKDMETSINESSAFIKAMAEG